LAPVYDRGRHVRSAVIHVQPGGNGAVFTDTHASIVYDGTYFQVLADNVTTGHATDGYATVIAVTDNKSNYALTEGGDGDNATAIQTEAAVSDNNTLFSNAISRASGTNFANQVWFAMYGDNVTMTGSGIGLASRSGIDALVDNGTWIGHNGNLPGTGGETTAAIGVTRMQVAEAGYGVYILTGRSTALTASLVGDNGTVTTLGTDVQSSAATILADAWCSTGTGASNSNTGYALVMSDNATTATGWVATKVFDNGTIETMTAQAGGLQVDSEVCAVTHLDGTFYLAVNDEDGGDNVSVFSSTDAVTWSQIGIDLNVGGEVTSIAITTNGSTVSDNAVWVAANVGGDVQLIHYEDIAGGSSYAWRSVSSLFDGAGTSGVSVAANGGTVIAVSAVSGGETVVGFWYDQ